MPSYWPAAQWTTCPLYTPPPPPPPPPLPWDNNPVRLQIGTASPYKWRLEKPRWTATWDPVPYLSANTERLWCVLMWLPSHTGIRGNEMADTEAKKATKKGTAADLKPSLAEIKSQTCTVARKMREETLKQSSETHGLPSCLANTTTSHSYRGVRWRPLGFFFFFFCVWCDDRAKSSGRWLLGSPPSAVVRQLAPRAWCPLQCLLAKTVGVLSPGVGRSEECAKEFAPQSHIHSGLNQQDQVSSDVFLAHSDQYANLDVKHEIHLLCTKMPMRKRGLTAPHLQRLRGPFSNSAPPPPPLPTLWVFRNARALSARPSGTANAYIDTNLASLRDWPVALGQV